jgi:type I restriction-modification system DNA methylase subunit
MKNKIKVTTRELRRAYRKEYKDAFSSKDMGEELIQRNLLKSPVVVDSYTYYNIGNSTLDQLKNNKIIPDKNYGKYSKRKPDGLLIDKQNKDNVKVIVVVEYKQPSDFKTAKQKIEAVQQCNDICQVLDSEIGIITDGQITIWINPREPRKENEYLDKTNNVKRSYSIIRNEDKKDLSEIFFIQTKTESDFDKLEDDTKNTLYYVKRIRENIDEHNSELKATEEVDPLGLATAVWQDIYINTGKDPTKCLYNVVELFIFKFLSDLNVLKSPYSFQFLIDMYDNGSNNKEVLKHYARNSRKEIRKLFPPSDKDGTTIINGTIFVDSEGNPVESQANLFRNSLKKYAKFGSLKHVKKEFKTKLFETFLKQSKDKSRLGQFFTPRKVVRTIVEMSNVDGLTSGARFCDPFCGVGGFLCEPLHKTSRKGDFIPKSGKIRPDITYHGFDKGMDDDEERTVILAKANMLIYLSEILEKNPTLTYEFSKVFNETFHLISDTNLGTLSMRLTEEKEKYDLILTNPPYITSGVTSIKDELKSEGLDDYYTAGGKGVDGLALEWIIRALKKGGKAFIVIPDGILNTSQNKNLRKFILDECFINCIISLPIKTFFNTPKKTFILGLTKKSKSGEQQDFPIFTYLVSNIGETLNINRFETEGKSDLEKAKDLFNTYKGSPKTFPVKEMGDSRCKLQQIKRFESESIWDIDKWWSNEEKIKLGINEEESSITIAEFKDKLDEFAEDIKQFKKMLGDI